MSKYLCSKGATLVLDEYEAGVRMCKVGNSGAGLESG